MCKSPVCAVFLLPDETVDLIYLLEFKKDSE